MSKYYLNHPLGQQWLAVRAIGGTVPDLINGATLEYFIDLIKAPLFCVYESKTGPILFSERIGRNKLVPAIEHPMFESFDAISIDQGACVVLATIASFSEFDSMAGRKGKHAYLRPGFAAMLNQLSDVFQLGAEGSGLIVETWHRNNGGTFSSPK